MDIKNYELVKTDQGYVIHLYLDPNSPEFSDELGSKQVEDERNLRKIINKLVKKQFKGVNIIAAKVILGTSLFATVPLDVNEVSAHEATFNMTYSFFGSRTFIINSVDQTKGTLNVISPSYFDINADGSLKLKTVDTTLVKEMHNRNIRVVPFLSNHWSRSVGEAALENRELLATQIADAVEKYNLDGVNVDIENVTEKHRDNYTDLVRLLSEKLPAHKEVSVAVAANPNHWKTGWHGSYDNKALSKYADYLMVMAYDESYTGGPVGPVASYDWVDRAMEAIVMDEGVDPNKVVLGLPFFGRYWNSSESTGGYGASNHQIESLVKKYNGTITFDEKYQSPKATFTIKESDPSPTIAGRTLKPGEYTAWFENDQSIQAKMRIMHKYNLKGVGSWSIGQENPSVWMNFNSWLASHDQLGAIPSSGSTYEVFPDVQNHWARDEILYVKQRGWFKGKTNTTFAPEESLTRAQAAAVLVQVLNLKSTSTSGQSFSDVSTNYWAYESIEIAKQHNLFTGRTDGTFGPNEQLTREQMAVVLDNIFRENYDPKKANKPASFQDVSNERWSYPAITAVKQQGIFEGAGDTFRPTGKVTRAQMAVVLTNAAPHISEKTGESSYPRTIKIGNGGADVTLLQIHLKRLGLSTQSATGYFNTSTESQVRTFQTNQSLTVDGIVGPITSGRILSTITK